MLEQIKEALQKGQPPRVAALVKQALDAKMEPERILQDALLAAMDVVGEGFGSGKLFIPEVMLAARAMQAGVEVLRPYLATVDGEAKECVIVGTVLGDQHDIGKNLVKIMLEGAGFATCDLGVNVAPERFLSAAREKGARLICASALLTTTMKQMEVLVSLAHEAELLVMVGGAPVTQAFADKIGADAYTKDAAACAKVAKQLLA